MSEDCHDSNNKQSNGVYYAFHCPRCNETISSKDKANLDILERIHNFDHRQVDKQAVKNGCTTIVKAPESMCRWTYDDLVFLDQCGIKA